MKHISKILKAILSILMLVSILSGCAKKEESSSITAIVHKDAKFDCADLNLTEEDFTGFGFDFGDSFNITFPNGMAYYDVPYFSGYYVKTGMPVIVSYPGNGYVLIANNNSDLWSLLNLKDGDEVKIELYRKGDYLSTQQALGQRYENDRSSYPSDEAFSNFRCVNVSNIKEDLLYRGASPLDNSRNRAAITSSLLEKYGIKTEIDLSDSDEEIQGYIAKDDFASPYAKELYEEGKTIALSMTSDYSASSYREALGKALKFMLKNDGPYYIHCMEGKDRTGFVCFVLEALLGSSYDEMCNDYMITYQNYYDITKEKDANKYNAVVELYFNTFVEFLSGKNIDEVIDDDFSGYARDYLLSCDMNDEEIDSIISLLSK